jgi:predicted RecA/RadA family phage recombinase
VALADATKNSILDAYARNVSYANAAVWVKLHTGDPGSAGTLLAAAETTRKQATFGAGAASGLISNTVALTWTAVAGSEIYTHVSFWTASTAGTYTGSAQLVAARAVTAGDAFTIAVGDMDLAI